MVSLYQSAFFQTLGWMLFDSLWKVGSLWALYIFITANGRWWGSNTRYVFAVAAMVGGAAWTIFGRNDSRIADDLFSSLPTYFSYDTQWFRGSSPVMPLVSACYILCLLILSFRHLVGYGKLQTDLSPSFIEPETGIQKLAISLAGQLGITKKVIIRMSETVKSPMTYGVFSSVIVLPVAFLNHLTIGETSSILAHELIHIRRHDYLVNLLVSVCKTCLFFNPFALLLDRTIREERENACDDSVIRMGIDPWQYAQALYTLGRQSAGQSSLVMQAIGNRTPLLNRVKRMLNCPETSRPASRARALISAASLFFLCLSAGLFLHLPQKRTVSAMSRTQNNFSAQISPAAENPKENPTAKVLRKTSVKSVIPTQKSFDHVVAESSGQAIHAESAAVPPPAPEAPDVMVSTYTASAEESRDYTMIIPETPVTPQMVDRYATSVPYVPSSTFYYTNMEDSLSAPGRKIIHL